MYDVMSVVVHKISLRTVTDAFSESEVSCHFIIDHDALRLDGIIIPSLDNLIHHLFSELRTQRKSCHFSFTIILNIVE